MSKTYYKATRKDGVTATRGSTMKFSHAAVHSGGSHSAGSTWFGRPDLAARYKGPSEVCEAVEITAQEYRALKAAAPRYAYGARSGRAA